MDGLFWTCIPNCLSQLTHPIWFTKAHNKTVVKSCYMPPSVRTPNVLCPLFTIHHSSQTGGLRHHTLYALNITFKGLLLHYLRLNLCGSFMHPSCTIWAVRPDMPNPHSIGNPNDHTHAMCQTAKDFFKNDITLG